MDGNSAEASNELRRSSSQSTSFKNNDFKINSHLATSLFHNGTYVWKYTQSLPRNSGARNHQQKMNMLCWHLASFNKHRLSQFQFLECVNSRHWVFSHKPRVLCHSTRFASSVHWWGEKQRRANEQVAKKKKKKFG